MTKKKRTKALLKKVRAFMRTDKALHYEGGLLYLCYIFGAEGFYPMTCAVPDLTEWERATLKRLLNLFRPTKNELIDIDPENRNKYSYEFSYTGVGADEPIDFCAPWFGYYGEKEAPMREFAFALIVAMLEQEAK